jgi:hypothetical protein
LLYNTIRPHASIGYKPPAPEVFVPAFAATAHLKLTFHLDHSAGAKPEGSGLCRPHPARHQACRPSRAGAYEISDGPQPQDGEGTRSGCATISAGPRRRGDRIVAVLLHLPAAGIGKLCCKTIFATKLSNIDSRTSTGAQHRFKTVLRRIR